MTEADFDFELRRMFLGFGGAIALLLLYFLFRVLRVFFAGTKVRGVVARVRTSDYNGRTQYSYVVRYEAPGRGPRLAHETQKMPLQEFKVGDAVTIYVKDGEHPACEILSWPRVLVSVGLILVVSFAMFAGYQHYLGPKKAGATPPIAPTSTQRSS